MHFLFKLFFRPVGILLASLGLGALGVFGLVHDPLDVPAQETLKSTTGKVQNASKITRKSRVNYEFEVVGADGIATKFRMPEREITEAQVRNIIGEQVTVLSGGERDIWELSQGGAKVISYDTTKKKRIESAKELQSASPYILGGSLFGLLITAFWWRRRGSVF